VTSFDDVAAEYEAGRPSYLPGVFDALEPLAGLRVLEGGAGTGIATVGLVERGARVVAFDVGHGVLTRLHSKVPNVAVVVADGALMPFPDGCADLVCFAQSWHWLDSDRRIDEAARVLARGGRWAAWWSHARADRQAWFEGWWDVVQAATVARRTERDTDWGIDLARSGLFGVREEKIAWVREMTVEQWMNDDRSKSYISSLPEPSRTSLLTTLDQIVREAFPSGEMQVPYETSMWIATRK
jgi:SAM-dependent methyltransferase